MVGLLDVADKAWIDKLVEAATRHAAGDLNWEALRRVSVCVYDFPQLALSPADLEARLVGEYFGDESRLPSSEGELSSREVAPALAHAAAAHGVSNLARLQHHGELPGGLPTIGAVVVGIPLPSEQYPGQQFLRLIIAVAGAAATRNNFIAEAVASYLKLRLLETARVPMACLGSGPPRAEG